MIKSKNIKKGNFNLKRIFQKLRITLDSSEDLINIRQMDTKNRPEKYFHGKKFYLN